MSTGFSNQAIGHLGESSLSGVMRQAKLQVAGKQIGGKEFEVAGKTIFF